MTKRRAAMGLLVASTSLLPFIGGANGQSFFMENVFDDPAFSDASSKLSYSLENGTTGIEINVSNAVPNQYYSIWLKLDGISPLNGIGSFPLINVSDIATMALSTPDSNLTPTAKSLGLAGDDGTGAAAGPNGFLTDANGDAAYSITLDYPLVEGGVFPFDEFDPSLSPVSLGSTPFLLSTLIHTDDVGHGLFPDGGPGTAAPWFQTSTFAVPEPSAILLLGMCCVCAVLRWTSMRLSNL